MDSVATNLLWYDLETWGRDARQSPICQFAAQLTDWQLQPVGEPVNISCALPEDLLPEPEAALVHQRGLEADSEALSESEFCARVHAVLSAPQQCIVGYNNIRFDDEFIRHLFFRNFYPPYAHTYQHGNSRWDLLDFIRGCALLRPECLHWPLVGNGNVSFRLEDLAAANGIELDAHDALADVRATIELTARVARNNRKLFEALFFHMHSGRRFHGGELFQPGCMLHVSGRLSVRHLHASLVQAVSLDSRRKKLHVLNLRSDNRELLDLSAEQLHERMFTRHSELRRRGLHPAGVKLVHLNKSPLLLMAPLSAKLLHTRPEIARRLGLNWQRAESHRLDADEVRELARKLAEVSDWAGAPAARNAPSPAHTKLYRGFIPDFDVDLFERFRALPPAELTSFAFQDDRLNDMRLAYKARNYPESLSAEERDQFYSSIDSDKLAQLAENNARLQAQYPEQVVLQQLARHYQRLQQLTRACTS